MENDRRDFLKKTALLGLTGMASSLFGRMLTPFSDSAEVEGGGDRISLPALPYGYDALEPFIDKETMKIHHTKHHQAYIDKLNTAGKEFDRGIDLAESCRKVTESTAALVRNNLGGHYNHSLFWQMMKPAADKKMNVPSGPLAEKINADFRSFEQFKSQFSEKAAKHFGSGWCWLIAGENNKLRITTTPNQDNPLMQVAEEKGKIILGLDVWEHAYYLKYQNKRPDYIAAWWNVVNWEKASGLFGA